MLHEKLMSYRESKELAKDLSKDGDQVATGLWVSHGPDEARHGVGCIKPGGR